MTGRPDEIIFQATEDNEGGFTARALGESFVTQADDLDAFKAAVRDAVLRHFEPDRAPRMIRLHLVRDFLVAV